MKNPWGPKLAPRVAKAATAALAVAPSVERRYRQRRGQPVQYVAHDGSRARARRLAQLARAGRGWVCASCRALHPFTTPIVIERDGVKTCGQRS